MPDISMCKNSKCELKEECYRYKAEPNCHRQAYAFFEPKKDERGAADCENFIQHKVQLL